MSEITILVPVYNEELFIESFYNSLLKQKNISREKVEVLFMDGNSTDNTLLKLKGFNRNNIVFKMKILHNAKRNIPSALNIGLKESAGNYILRLDVHSSVSEDYISRIYSQLVENSSEYCNFGGRTNIKGYDKTSLVVSKALSNKWVLGGGDFRYSKKRMEVDTVFPGAWLKTDLLKAGGWDENWLINEDVELNYRLRKITHKKIIIDPSIVVDYFPRNTLKKLGKQYFNYGYWRIKTAKKHEESMRLSHAAPLILLLTLMFFTILAFLNIKLFIFFLLSNIVLYIIYLTILSLKIFEKEEVAVGWATIFVIQFNWILGAFKGYFIFGFPLKGYSLLLKKLFTKKRKFGSKETV